MKYVTINKRHFFTMNELCGNLYKPLLYMDELSSSRHMHLYLFPLFNWIMGQKSIQEVNSLATKSWWWDQMCLQLKTIISICMFIVGFVASKNQNNLIFLDNFFSCFFFPRKYLGNFMFSHVNETNSGYFWKFSQYYFRSQNWPYHKYK
jgi:hypothetical protein